MRRLILFRHGKAEMAGFTGGDKERPLAERGRADCAATALWLLAMGYVPDLVFISSAVRTQASWASASPVFPGARAETAERLYLAGTDNIMDLLEGAPAEARTVMVVGHNPGLQDLAVRLAAESHAPERQFRRMAEGFPTAAAAVFGMKALEAMALEALYEPPCDPLRAPCWAFTSPLPGELG
jgi:phosphohistidine phosphatase